jgi:phosphate transport system permease protein
VAVDSQKMNAAAVLTPPRAERRSEPPPRTALPRGDFRRLHQGLMYGLMSLGMLLVLVPTVMVFYTIFANGWRQLTLTFLTQQPLDNGLRGGIGPAILGTFALMIGTVVLSLPLGVFAAIYLTEYARKGPIVRVIRMAIVNLAGVPSIVHGLFGLGLFVYFLGGKLDQLLRHDQPIWQNQTLLWGSATLAVLVLPIVITATEEALLSVPRSFREGSMGLGATKWQTIRRVILPSAVPGILTGAILAVGRAAGETAPILLTAALSWTSNTGMPRPSEPVMALPYHLYYVVTQVANAPLRLQYGIAMTLLLLVFVVNLTAIVLRARLRRARRW